jgi:hypothetical protein
MKTKMFFVAAAVAVISLSSCKKDYECKCEFDQAGITGSATTSINDAKKKDAEDACDELDAESGYTCTLSEK